ncbi:hypothetical protein AMAG_10601 [Allomyces macrogynus ATCC 38327]|uniref:Uncharacterized protein n=1 Tax=Allomyces macrogynus (strain ATCC 38327) TaxID=578462 RepID=A0A0L0SR05_ALLM3|nr:hypothetical protein AMAG_10601 [Allomyces macrogynus ATCC 38327]|eukprot:KNE64936.1 hypothetical protein AMAG_10601 [Allomyces macrogynus ATCC 38327]
MSTVTKHRASATAKAMVSTNKQVPPVDTPQPRTMLIETSHMNAFIEQLGAAISDYQDGNPSATLNWPLITSLQKLKQDMEKVMREGAMLLESNTSDSMDAAENTAVPAAAADSASRSSTVDLRYSMAVPSGKKTVDVVDAIAVHEVTDDMPCLVRPFLKNVHQRRMLADKKKVVEPGKTKRAMPKMDVVVVKDGVYYYTVGWLALVINRSKFRDYETALKKMREAINKDADLRGWGKEKKLAAIKAGNFRMWMVTEEAFKERLLSLCVH